jgi:hypothetical protein
VLIRYGLSFHVLIADLLRDPVLKPGVPTFWIVPEFDIPHNFPVRMLTGRILGATDALFFRAAKNDSAIALS